MSTIAAIVIGALLTGATVAGVVHTVNDKHSRTVPGTNSANVQLYGSH